MHRQRVVACQEVAGLVVGQDEPALSDVVGASRLAGVADERAGPAHRLALENALVVEGERRISLALDLGLVLDVDVDLQRGDLVTFLHRSTVVALAG